MKDRLTCNACNEPIPNGEAVLTSRLFEQRAWHREHAPGRRVTIPEQRTGAHDELVRART